MKLEQTAQTRLSCTLLQGPIHTDIHQHLFFKKNNPQWVLILNALTTLTQARTLLSRWVGGSEGPRSPMYRPAFTTKVLDCDVVASTFENPFRCLLNVDIVISISDVSKAEEW